MRDQSPRPTEVTAAAPAVLVIDDETNNLDVVHRALHKEFEVHLANSPAEAFRILSRLSVTVVIADQRMPEMTGVEFLQRAIAIQPAAKRLLLTAYADVEAIVHAVNLGKIHHFVQKPFDPAALRSTVAQLAQLSTLESENAMLLDNLKSVVTQLREKEAMLARNLDERERELIRANEELKAKNELLEHLALRDGLTGLYNHRSFQQRLREEVARSQRQSAPLSLIMADVDHFKRVNDVHGHPAGDSVLKYISGMLSGSIPGAPPSRKSDLVARYGGEEFAIILLDTPKEGAAVRAERLREALISGANKVIDGSISMSFGVAAYPDDALSAEELIQRADDALMRAKTSGRNQVVSWAQRPAAARSQVRSLADILGSLGGTLRRERCLSLITMRLTDGGRLERHYGLSGVTLASDAFERIAIAECDDLIPASSLLGVVAADRNLLQVFLRVTGDVVQVGPRYLEQISERLSARVESRLGDELVRNGMGLARVVSGHATQLFSPTNSIEKQLERLVDDALGQARVAADVRRAQDKLEIQRLILDGGVRTVVQPVLNDGGRKIVGYEALSRGPERSPLEAPVVMLDLAEDTDLVTELDLCMARSAFRAAKHLPDEMLFFVNLLPTTLTNAAFFREELPRMVEESGLQPKRVVLELSERQSADHHAFMRTLEKLRTAGFVLGLDDLGTQNANLAEIAAFRPEWLKLDRSLVHHIDQDPVRSDLVSAVMDFGRKQGSRIVAEGVETASELALLKKLGVEYYQGFLFGRPQPPEELPVPSGRKKAAGE
jgi:diguanylate cyclase (GGDEF)-like protein